MGGFCSSERIELCRESSEASVTGDRADRETATDSSLFPEYLNHWRPSGFAQFADYPRGVSTRCGHISQISSVVNTQSSSEPSLYKTVERLALACDNPYRKASCHHIDDITCLTMNNQKSNSGLIVVFRG